MTIPRHRAAPRLAVVLALAALSVGCGQLAVPTAKTPDVPYVPTHKDIVDVMLSMASVGPTDVLYDLGSGDGRVVIAAARDFGARGVGYEIDPRRVREANASARRAGVSDQVRFVQGDIFEADIREATVVTLYLLPDVNLRLRPKLLSELAPGTRIVSHNYDMGDWLPDKRHRMEINGSAHFVYFWTVPPRPSGR